MFFEVSGAAGAHIAAAMAGIDHEDEFFAGRGGQIARGGGNGEDAQQAGKYGQHCEAPERGVSCSVVFLQHSQSLFY